MKKKLENAQKNARRATGNREKTVLRLKSCAESANLSQSCYVIFVLNYLSPTCILILSTKLELEENAVRRGRSRCSERFSVSS